MAPLTLLRPITDTGLSRMLVPCVDPQYTWRGRVYEWNEIIPAMNREFGAAGTILFLEDAVQYRGRSIQTFKRTKPTWPSRVHVIADDPHEVR